MKNILKHIISKLFFRYCFEESKLAETLMCYHVPETMRKLDGTKIDGQFLYAQIEYEANKQIFKSLIDIPVPGDN